MHDPGNWQDLDQRERTSSDQWLDSSVPVRERGSASGREGGSQAEKEQLGPPAFPGVTGARHLCYCLTLEEWDVSSLQSNHVCVKTGHSCGLCICVFAWERLSRSFKWGVAVTSETSHLWACLVCIGCRTGCLRGSPPWACCWIIPLLHSSVLLYKVAPASKQWITRWAEACLISQFPQWRSSDIVLQTQWHKSMLNYIWRVTVRGGQPCYGVVRKHSWAGFP